MRVMISGLAMISILLGMASMVTPIPGGTLFIAGGLTALICSSPSAQFCVMWLRSRLSWFNTIIFWLESKVGSRIKVISRALSKTSPPEGVTLSHREFVSTQRDQNKI